MFRNLQVETGDSEAFSGTPEKAKDASAALPLIMQNCRHDHLQQRKQAG